MPKTISIFRIEHILFKKGPFRADYPARAKITRQIEEKMGSLIPHNDGIFIKKYPNTYVFGCIKKEDLVKWVFIENSFTENIALANLLGLHNFKIFEYSLLENKVVYGNSRLQVLFDSTGLLPINSFSPLEFFIETHPNIESSFHKAIANEEGGANFCFCE